MAIVLFKGALYLFVVANTTIAFMLAPLKVTMVFFLKIQPKNFHIN